MEDPDPNGPSHSVPVAAALLASFATFLTLTLHTLLFHRGLYPPASFLTARAYNLPVHQSRHPGLCTWISDAVAAVVAQLQTGAVRRIAVVVHRGRTLEVVERWVLDIERFPAWGDVSLEEPEGEGEGEEGEGEGEEEEEEEEGDLDDLSEDGEGEYVDVEVDADDKDSESEDEDEEEEEEVNWTDINEALRGALRRIAHAAEGMPALPAGSTFTLAVELRDGEAAPIGHPQPWIPSQPKLQPPTSAAPNQGSSLGGRFTVPLRSVHAGPLFFECWVEQGPSPRKLPPSKSFPSKQPTKTPKLKPRLKPKLKPKQKPKQKPKTQQRSKLSITSS